jgi:hypothetical protein
MSDGRPIRPQLAGYMAAALKSVMQITLDEIFIRRRRVDNLALASDWI